MSGQELRNELSKGLDPQVDAMPPDLVRRHFREIISKYKVEAYGWRKNHDDLDKVDTYISGILSSQKEFMEWSETWASRPIPNAVVVDRMAEGITKILNSRNDYRDS